MVHRLYVYTLAIQLSVKEIEQNAYLPYLESLFALSGLLVCPIWTSCLPYLDFLFALSGLLVYFKAGTK